MSVIMPYDLIRFQIPALHELVLPGREQVGMMGTECQSPHWTDVSGEGDAQGVVAGHARLREVEYFDDAIGTAGGE